MPQVCFRVRVIREHVRKSTSHAWDWHRAPGLVENSFTRSIVRLATACRSLGSTCLPPPPSRPEEMTSTVLRRSIPATHARISASSCFCSESCSLGGGCGERQQQDTQRRAYVRSSTARLTLPSLFVQKVGESKEGHMPPPTPQQHAMVYMKNQ